METGTKISAVAHVGLIGWVLLEGVFSSAARPPEQVTDVSVISAQEFAALTAYKTPPVLSQEVALPEPVLTEDAALPQTTQDAAVPEITAPDAVAEPTTEAEPQPPLPEPVPQVPDDVAVLVPSLPEPPDIQDLPQITPEVGGLVRSDRVALDPVAPPPDDVAIDVDSTPAVTPDDTGDVEQESQQATAEEAAADRIVTEAEEVDGEPTPDPSPEPEQLAAVPQVIPRLRPPNLQVPEPEPEAVAQPATEPEPEPETTLQADTAAAVEDALRQLQQDQSAQTAPVPSGPPLSFAEKDGIRVGIGKCWNVGASSTDALQVTVVVGVSWSQDGKPDAGSIRLISSEGGSGRAVETAFQAARRAILRCSSRVDLPAEKYGQWKDMEITFNPSGMRVK